MKKVFRNRWTRSPEGSFERCDILNQSFHPEGLDISRIRFSTTEGFTPAIDRGHIVTVLKGGGRLHVTNDHHGPLTITEGVHMYIPPHYRAILTMYPASELLCVSGTSEGQTRGDRLLIRDETFLAACAHESSMLRWTFTAQYLSRRVFLHHDPVLLSRSGNPVSWFRTTMFDVGGLPCNDEGKPVFKMSYNSRTELNVCYDVKGDARVRMARHPYGSSIQSWYPWRRLDGESNYHLNETDGEAEEERRINKRTGETTCLRNKHEVSISQGHVTLCCLFDPAPTGMERHRPGEYSDYEPLSAVVATEAYRQHRQTIDRFDEMVDVLSVARATGTLSRYRHSQLWKLYEEGRDAQATIETELHGKLADEGIGRERVVEAWMQPRAWRPAPSPAYC